MAPINRNKGTMNDPSDRCPSGTDDEPPEIGPAGLISVDVIENGGNWPALCEAPEAVIVQAAEAAARFPETKLAGTSAAVALSNDAQVAELNASFRGRPTPTNVLSFPATPSAAPGDHPEPGAQFSCFAGDIILAAETVAREARELNIPLRHHLQHLVVHGLLHLSGFDHETDGAAEEMEALETRILASLDIPDPYAEEAYSSEDLMGAGK